MWVIRVLTGKQAGLTVPLKRGALVIGRAPQCDLTIVSPGVSKEHARLEISEQGIRLVDLDSSNGTFVNGLKISSHHLRPGDKIGIHDVILEIAPVMAQMPGPGPMYHGNVAYQQNPEEFFGVEEQPVATPAKPQGLEGLWQAAKAYVNQVVLPGIYKLTEWLEFRWILIGFMGAFIIFVTSLSSIPLMRILKTSIEMESQRRALTIARTLAQVNRSSLMQGLESGITVDIAQREPGVQEALIVSNVDGNIIAPASKAGRYPDYSFVHSARKTGKEVVEQIDDSTIGALVPIEFYNANTGNQSIAAHALVIYNMGALAVDDGRTLSLFIQTFFIALVVGGILFFFLYKLIEFPITSLNHQIDQALKDGHNNLQLNYQFPALQSLISNINSALSRASGPGDQPQSLSFDYDRGPEMNNLVQLVGFAALVITAHDNAIAAVNAAFEERTGLQAFSLVNNSYETITDQALKLSIKDLIERLQMAPDQLATNPLEFAGENFEVVAQAIYGSSKIAYYLIVLLPADLGGGG